MRWRPPRQGSSRAGARRLLAWSFRLALAATAGAVIAVLLPAFPSLWADVTAPDAITDANAAGSGTVTVARCVPAFLGTWRCEGTFSYADPMAQGWQVTGNTVLANDPAYHRRGASVDAALLTGTHRAYLWGNCYAAIAAGLLAGLLLCLPAAGVLLLPCRRVPAGLAGWRRSRRGAARTGAGTRPAGRPRRRPARPWSR